MKKMIKKQRFLISQNLAKICVFWRFFGPKFRAVLSPKINDFWLSQTWTKKQQFLMSKFEQFIIKNQRFLISQNRAKILFFELFFLSSLLAEKIRFFTIFSYSLLLTSRSDVLNKVKCNKNWNLTNFHGLAVPCGSGLGNSILGRLEKVDF